MIRTFSSVIEDLTELTLLLDKYKEELLEFKNKGPELFSNSVSDKKRRIISGKKLIRLTKKVLRMMENDDLDFKP